VLFVLSRPLLLSEAADTLSATSSGIGIGRAACLPKVAIFSRLLPFCAETRCCNVIGCRWRLYPPRQAKPLAKPKPPTGYRPVAVREQDDAVSAAVR